MEQHTRRMRKRGAVLVEAALVLPFLILMIFGIIEFSMIGHHKLALAQGARAGAREAAVGRSVSEVKQKVRTASAVEVPDDRILVEFNSSDDGQGSWAAAGDSGSGTNNVPPGRLLRVRIDQWPHQMVTGGFFSWLPGVQDETLPLSAEMVMRRE